MVSSFWNVIGIWLVIIVIALRLQPIFCDRAITIGCYQYRAGLNGSGIQTTDPDNCISVCKKLYFRYAVLQSGDCGCTNILSSEELDKRICTNQCGFNQSQFCGGIDAQNYYDTQIQVAGPPQNFQLRNVTDTIIIMKWDLPELKQLLTHYVIRAKIIKTYAKNKLDVPPQWTVQGDEKQIELPNMYPGTKYNVSIQSGNGDVLGGIAHLEIDTVIGVPDLEPSSPLVKNRTDKTITVEIQPQENNMGPITGYRIVVMIIDGGDILQNFDESLLTNYRQSQEYGINYYICGEIDYQDNPQIFTVGDGRQYRGYQNPPLPSKSQAYVSIGIVSSSNGITKTRYSSHFGRDQLVIQPVDGTDDDGGQVLYLTLIFACIIFGMLLVISIMAYIYLRMRADNRMQRLPDLHELSPVVVPSVQATNGGYVGDDISRDDFNAKLTDIVKGIDPLKVYTRNTLTLNVNNIIGVGNFGDVISGNLFKNNSLYQCRVHIVSEDDMDANMKDSFLKDFGKISHLSDHDNLLEFLGISQSSDWFYLIFEDAPYILKKKLVESRAPPNIDPHRFSMISEEFVINVLCQIASALDYLSLSKIVHKHINSYNIRLTASNNVKLTVLETASLLNDQTKKIDETRWQPIEVLRYQRHSRTSDIWSFGCVIWECCSLGGTLYANINTEDLLSRITGGARPEQPMFVYDDIYQLMLNCWDVDPENRPNFNDLYIALQQLQTSPQHVISFDRNESVVLPYYLPLLENQQLL